MIIGGIDVGTTGCKLALYSENAGLLKTYYSEYDAVHKNGLHEIDFNNVRQGVLNLLKTAVAEYRIDTIGVTSFGETFAMLDENGICLAPSMLYTDPRGSEECEKLCELLGENRLTLITGVKPDAMYSIAKIMWQKKHNPKAFSDCRRILLGEDYIIYCLTGIAQIDYSLAARTAAFDIEKKKWSEDIFAAAEIDISLMSVPVPPGTVAGNITDEIKGELGINYDITVVNGCHDQVAGMIGSGVFSSDTAMDGTGTVECIPVILNEKPVDPEFYRGGYSVVPYLNGMYACYALSFTGGAVLKWFRDNFAEAEKERAEAENRNVYAELDGKIGINPTGILVLPHFAGAATPYMDTGSRAAFIGITLETTKYDIYKALMEGTSYEMLLNFNILKRFTGKIKEIRATGGGAASDVWLQIKADILNTEITALSCREVGAAGTAILAGTAMGVFNDMRAVAKIMAPVRQVFVPNRNNTEQYGLLYQKYRHMYDAVRNLI